MYKMYDEVSDSSDEEFENAGDELAVEKKKTLVNRPVGKDTTKSPKRTKPKSQQFTNAGTKISFGGSRKICGQESMSMSVEPTSLHFESVQPGILYVMTMSIRNISKTAQRIRIKAPKSGFFALNYIPSGVVSPGLDIRAQVECQLPEGSSNLEYLDSVTVVMGEECIEVPIVATKRVANMSFDSLLNFGFVAKGHKASRNVYFENTGEIPGSIKFVSSPYLTFQPPRMKLNPGDKQVVSVTLECVDVGVFREVVEVQIEGALSNAMLDVNAHCVSQTLSLLQAKGGIIEEIDFGALFYGETRKIHAYVVNSGPEQLSFSAVCSDEDSRSASRGKTPGSSDEDAADASEKNSLTFSPSEGVIKPFSQLPVIIAFCPDIPVPAAGFRTEYLVSMKESSVVERKVILESIETNQKIVVDVTASVSMADIVLSPNVLNFGSCPVNDRRDILVELTNNSVSSIPFSFSTHAQFRVVPPSGVLDAHQSRTVIATFHPGQLGQFRTALKMSVSNGLQMLDLQLSGDANEVGTRKTLVGGLHTTPLDFEEKHKFVNPATVDAEIKEQQETKLRKQLDKTRSLLRADDPMSGLRIKEREGLSISTGSLTREAIYGQVEDVSKTGIPGENHPLTLKRQHDAVYNTYLQSQHLQRVMTKKLAQQKLLTMRGGIDRSDPFGVDMGMERSLEEPRLPLPKADTELWLASKTGRGTDGKGRLPFDENRLIQRKYSDTPSTQAELRDCTAELSGEELKLVHSAQKASFTAYLVFFL
jgi:hypothetical protein